MINNKYLFSLLTIMDQLLKNSKNTYCPSEKVISISKMNKEKVDAFFVDLVNLGYIIAPDPLRDCFGNIHVWNVTEITSAGREFMNEYKAKQKI